MRPRRLASSAIIAVLAIVLAACGSSESDSNGETDSSGEYPITIEHALGTTTIESKPERVATVAWGNQEVPLALGVVPVGMAAADFGDDDGDGVLPWVEEKLKELDAETPVLFDETDGIDFEAVAETEPDVILAAYSGLTQEEYDTLSEIAPVVAYPDTAWGAQWRDVIETNAQGMGMADEGKKLVADLEKEIEDATADYPQLEGVSTMFLTHVDASDLSEVNFYTSHDPRPAFFNDLGMATPKSVEEASEKNDQFSGTISAEQVDTFSDVELIVTYGDDKLVETLESDPLLSQMPAVADGAIVSLPEGDPLGTAANPTPLAISWVLDDYLAELAKAADKIT